MEYNVINDLKLIIKYLEISEEDLSKELKIDISSILKTKNKGNKINETNIKTIYDFIDKKHVNLNELKENFYKEEFKDKKILFHGSKRGIIGDLTIDYSKESNDFGVGFYAGETYFQASTYVGRIISSSIYILKFDDNKNYKSMEFFVDKEWMFAVAYFRGTLGKYKNNKKVLSIINKIKECDYIIAPIADNRMFDIMDQFFNGLITDEQCKHALAATNLGRQYVFLNNEILKSVEIVERLYLSESERKRINENNELNYQKAEIKMKMAYIKYKNKGKYLEELLK